jgi:O-antigen/teichoic acid export membrane protein
MSAFALAYFAAVACALVLVRRQLGFAPRPAEPVGEIAAFIRHAAPIAATASLIAIYARIDVLLLSKLDVARAVAIYNVPLLLVEITFIVPAAIATSVFPLLAQQFAQAREAGFEAVHLLWRLFFLASVPIALVLGLGGTDLIVWLFGERYRDSGDVLAILAVCIPAGFVNYLTWYVLLADHRETGRLRALSAGLVLNIALNVALIPAWGPRGSAVALAVSDVTMVAWLCRLVNREIVAVPFLRLLGRPLLALVPAAAVATALYRIDGLVAGLAAAAVYAGFLVLGGYVSPEEWRPLTGPLHALAGRARGRR